MTPRDRAPYCEQTDATTGGALHAMHNLSTDDLHLLLEAMKSRRVLYAIRQLDVLGTPEPLRREMVAKADRIDILTATITSILHRHEPVPHPTAG